MQTMQGTRTTVAEITQRVTDVTRLLKDISGVTDQAIAEATGLSRSVVQQRITGVSKWTTAELYLLAGYFGVPIELFFMDVKEAAIEAINRYDVQALRFRNLRKASSGCMLESPGQKAA